MHHSSSCERELHYLHIHHSMNSISVRDGETLQQAERLFQKVDIGCWYRLNSGMTLTTAPTF
jgi:hypothetical protein